MLCGSLSPNRPKLENILPELKTVLPNADFVIARKSEDYVDLTELLRDEDPGRQHWDGRGHFFAAAAKAVHGSCKDAVNDRPMDIR